MAILSRNRHPDRLVTIGCDRSGAHPRTDVSLLPAGANRAAAMQAAREAGWLVRSRRPDAPRRREMDLCPEHVPACHYQPCTEPAVTTDHIVPAWWGGKDRHSNYIDACYTHNKAKSSTMPTCDCRDCSRAVRGWLDQADWQTLPPARQHRALALMARARPDLVSAHLGWPVGAAVADPDPAWTVQTPTLAPPMPSAPTTPYDPVCSLLTRALTNRAAVDPGYYPLTMEGPTR